MNPSAHPLLRSTEQQGAEGTALVRAGMEGTLKAARQVDFALVMLCEGAATTIIRQVPEGQGLEAWRLFYAEFEPKLPGRSLGLLKTVMTYKFSDS
eukprot:14656611-Alexandrium_andersonii.AAC.1